MTERKYLFLIFFVLFVGGISSTASHAAHAQDTTPPTTPASISASVTPASQVYVSWSDSTDNVGVIGYYVYRNNGIVANTPGYTYYTDLPPAGAYNYTVAAYDAAGNISAQSSVAFVTVDKDTTPPTAPANLVAVPSSSSIALLWDASTDNVGVAGYYIYRNNIKQITQSAITSNSYTDYGLNPGTTYSYFVLAYDASGNTSDRTPSVMATAIFDVTLPSTPANLTLTPISPTEIDLAWQASTDNIKVIGYNLYRDGSLIATVTSNSYADTSLSPQTTYAYSLTAYDEVNNISPSTPSPRATTFPPDNYPPSVPKNLIATALSSSAVNLTWQPSTDNVKTAGYYVYRDDAQIASTASTSYMDSGLASGTAYLYAVRAYDTSSNVSAQSSVAITTPATDPTPSPGNNPPPDNNPPPNNNPKFTFTVSLYFGLRNDDVKNLQSVLIAQGDLDASYATGYFGGLTQKAVQKFQCAQSLVCSGGPASTGWGFVGRRTRSALNAAQ